MIFQVARCWQCQSLARCASCSFGVRSGRARLLRWGGRSSRQGRRRQLGCHFYIRPCLR